MNFRWLFSLGAALAFTLLSACGTDDGGITLPGDEFSDRLVFATPEEIEAGQVLPHSYLVAFRSQSERSGLYFSHPDSQRRFHNNWLLGVPGMAQQRYLASLDLARPGRSFHWQAELRKSPPFQMFWDGSQVDTQEAHLVQVDFGSEAEARQRLEAWYERHMIWYAEPNYISQLASQLEETLIDNFNKPEQFPWLAQIDFIQAMESMIQTPAQGSPVIAVLDSGIDVTHNALSQRVFYNEQGQNKLCVNDRKGCNTTANRKDLLGDGEAYPAGTRGFGQACPSKGQCWHGTHVAGIIAADGGSDYAGVCPYCKILNVKVVDIRRAGNQENFSIQDSSIIAGLAYVSAFTVGGEPLVRVINASFGKFQRSRSVEVFVRALRDFGRGILVVAAAGNEDTMKRQFPAAFDDVLAVANVRSIPDLPKKSTSSNFGVWIDLAAPGDGPCVEGGSDLSFQGSGILSSAPGNRFGCLAGTSMASPVVAGVAGLILAKEPNLNHQQLRDRLIRSARPDELYRDGVNNAYRPSLNQQQLIPLLGSGVVNANLALNPNIPKSPAVLVEKNEVVRPGCASLGKAPGSFGLYLGGAMSLLLPLLIVFSGRK